MLGRGCGRVKCISSSKSPKQLKADSGILETLWAVACRSIRLPSFNGLCINVIEIALFIYQPRSQRLSSLPPLVVGTETLVAAGHVTTQNLGGRKICWKGRTTGFSSRPNVLDYPPTLRFWMDRWSHDQPQLGSLFQRLKETEKRDPGNDVVYILDVRLR